MIEEVVKFKGSREGITLLFDKRADYETIEQDIRSKLLSGADFFRCGATVLLTPGELAPAEEEKLTKLFHQFGVIVRKAGGKAETAREKAAQPTAPTYSFAPPTAEMTVIDHTLRSGQVVTAPGSVLICGNVNPGAEIVAGGSIDVRGTCRGIVHAGAYGDASAFVIADHLMPVQIRIASYIAQAPDQVTKSVSAERASVKDGQIVIETIER